MSKTRERKIEINKYYNKNMKNKYWVILILTLIILIFLFLSYKYQKRIQNISNPIQGIKFTGIVTETNNGCWADGVCSIKVDDKWIVAEIGGLRPPNSKPEIRGNLIGISFSQDTDKYIGKKVEVYAKQTDNNSFTIYGNEKYYIKLLE